MQEERLIELVRQNRFLYDKSHKDYKKHLKNERKWAEIAAELNVSSEIVKKRWRTIKDRYIRIKKENSDLSGRRKAIKYRFAKMLKFLDESNVPYKSPHNDFNGGLVMSFDQLDDLKDVKSEPSDFQLDESQNTSTFPDIVITRTPTKRTRKTKASPKVAEDVFANTNNELVLSLLKAVKNDCKPMTKERGFCELLAMQLEEADLPSENFRDFQIKVIQLLSEEISSVKAKN